MLNLEARWYRPSHGIVTTLLRPLSWIFAFIVAFRRFLYRFKFKKIHHFPVPIIVVGNITVGGTGKTPFVIWLAELLKSQGFRPGIVTRGVGGAQQREPRWVNVNSAPKLVGDEAVLLVMRSQCPVVIGIDRVAAIKELLSKTDCNVVISDDGLQHYRMGRDIEIAIIDGARGLGNKSFLPAGPLRESPNRLKEVDFVVEQVTSVATPYPFESFASEEGFSMELIGDHLVSVRNPEHQIPLKDFQHSSVHAVAAIGNPKRFFSYLHKAGFDILEHPFPDHHLYQARDFNFADRDPIIMTEKDMVKCREFADERFWYFPVGIKIAASFKKALLTKISELEKK